jgi:hypothetical protein
MKVYDETIAVVTPIGVLIMNSGKQSHMHHLARDDLQQRIPFVHSLFAWWRRLPKLILENLLHKRAHAHAGALYMNAPRHHFHICAAGHLPLPENSNHRPLLVQVNRLRWWELNGSANQPCLKKTRMKSQRWPRSPSSR